VSATSSELIAAAREHVTAGITSTELSVSASSGGVIVDADGRRLIDFAAGIGSLNLGHSAPAVIEAIHAQVDRYLHQCAIVALYEPYVELCRRLGEIAPSSGPQRTLLVNSGSEAVDNAVKAARAATGRRGVVVLERGFHGRTMLGLGMAGRVVPFRKGLGPFVPEIYHAPAPYAYRGFGEEEALAGLRRLFEAEVDPSEVACLFLEPVQGEGGIIPLPDGYTREVGALCRELGILLVADEIQCGLRRTGPMWGIEHSGVEFDLMVSGKSLGGGLPLSALTGREEVMNAVGKGGYGGTFGGNPVSCAAALALLDGLEDPALEGQIEALVAKLRGRLDGLPERYPQVGEVRGRGAMLGIEMVVDPETRTPAPDLADRVVAEGRANGVVTLTAGFHRNVIRLLPPLTLGEAECEAGLRALEAALDTVLGEAG
jgi:4-aminobutyrate aminotransferase